MRSSIVVPDLGIVSDDVDVSLTGEYDDAPPQEEDDIEIKADVPGGEIIEELAPDIDFENGEAPAFDGAIEDFGDEE